MRNQPFNPLLPADDSSDGSLIDPPSAIRFKLLAILFPAALAIVLARVVWVQTMLQDEYLDALNSTTVEYERIPARDGRILSDNAEVLATDVEQYSVQVHYRWLQDPVDDGWLKRQMRSRLSRSERRNEELTATFRQNLESQRSQMWRQLADVTGTPPSVLANQRTSIQSRVQRISDSVNRRSKSREGRSELADNIVMKIASKIRQALTTPPRRSSPDRIVVREEESWHEVVADVSLEIAGKIREQPQMFPGVRVIAGTRRTYPLATVAPHVVGARTIVSDEALSGGNDADHHAREGRFGVEKTYNRDLQGRPGVRRIVRDRRMRIVESEIERNPVGGRDVVLTLNVALQQHAERLLDEALTDRPGKWLTDEDSQSSSAPQQIPTGGAVVVMDVVTGRVIAAASAPRFSLSLFTAGTQEAWKAVNADPRHPFLNRIVQTALTPGSVAKIVTAAAGLETGTLRPDDLFYCQGFLERPDQHRCLLFRITGHGHDQVDLSRAIAQSCNVYFFTAARQMGFVQLRQWYDRFGFGRLTGVDLPFETSGTLPGSSEISSQTDHQFRHETLGLAIGQSRVTVTPLQLVRAFAAIANGGWLVTPHVVSIDGTPRMAADVDDRPRDVVRRRISGLSPETAEHIREGLAAAVQQPYGTAFRTGRLDGTTMAGKTGTAQTAGGRPDHAWFAGYVPADAPRYAFAVVLEHGGSGSRTAVPVAREVCRRMLSLGLLP